MGEDGRSFFDRMLSRAKKHDPAAREELFQGKHSWLLAWARPRIGPRLGQRHGASDVVQSALGEAVQGLSQFGGRDKSSFLSWLLSIAGNKIKQAIRGDRRKRRDVAREEPLQPGEGNDVGIEQGQRSNAAHRTSEPEDSDYLEPALELLSEEERRRVLLKYRDELTFDEMEQREGVSSGTLRKQARRTTEKLRVRIILLKRMDELDFLPLQKRTICLKRFFNAPDREIGSQLKIPLGIVERWITDARARGLLNEGDGP
jgi:RNA polymerase sigma factor (sigma-70 family)